MSLFEKLAHQISAKAEDAAPQPLSVSMVRAADIDDFVERLRGYQLEFMQIDRGPFGAESIQTQVGGVLLSAAHYRRALVQSGEPPPGTVTFAVRTFATPALWQGRDFGRHDLLVGKPGIEIDLISRPDYGVATASFPLELVKEAAERFGWPGIAHAPTSLLVGLKHDGADMLRASLDTLLCEAVARPFDKRAGTWAVSKQEDLLHALLQCLLDPLRLTQPGSNGERARVLKAALTAINDRPEDVLTVGDLCRIARTSERTLHYAFTERFGLPPAHYMKAHRLNRARNDLCREHEPLMKIADVANKWGFWHLGQFAKDYRSWFRELPSDTYAKKARHESAP